LSGVVTAQSVIPGTFNTAPQQPGNGNNSGYIVSPPTIALGNGITPTVVTNQDTISVTLPQNTSINGPTVQANVPATVNENAATMNNVATNSDQQIPGQASRNFDFVNAPSGENKPIVGSMADDSISLGELARKVRNGKQIAKRSITNADVNALSGTPQSDNAQLGTDANGTAGGAIARPATQQTDPFTPPTQPDGSKPNAQQGQGISPRGSARPAQAPADRSGRTEKERLPNSSSSLPLLGTLGAISTLAGIAYFKLR